MGCCMRLPCCIDDSYDYKCDLCKKKLPRDQDELFLLQDSVEDKIFCSRKCLKKGKERKKSSAKSDRRRKFQQQSLFLVPDST